MGYQYFDEGPISLRPTVICLHGMLGEPANWSHTLSHLAANGFRVLVPALPIYDLSLDQSSVSGLMQYIRSFLDTLGANPVVLMGNSLGGHVALLYALAFPECTSALVLSGASGIYEVEMGTSTMRRKDRDFIRERAARTFFSPHHASDHLVDRVYEIVNDRSRALRLITMARSVLRENIANRLARITAPTLLLWGREDSITPPDVAETFRRRLPCAQLFFLDHCGHAPMIEHPDGFNRRLLSFLKHLPRQKSESTAACRILPVA